MKPVVRLGRVRRGPEGFSEEVMLAEALRLLGREKARRKKTAPGVCSFTPYRSSELGVSLEFLLTKKTGLFSAELLTCFVFPRWG